MAKFILIFLLIFNPFLYSETRSLKVTETFSIDQYIGDTRNLNQLIGYYLTFDATLPVSFYMGTSWAITGDYGGYGTASFGPKFTIPLSDHWIISFATLVGVGGHAALPLGNGFHTWFQTGLHYYISETIHIMASYGTLHYTSGSYTIDTLSVAFNYSYDIFFTNRPY